MPPCPSASSSALRAKPQGFNVVDSVSLEVESEAVGIVGEGS
jgi:hypothetical protein